MNIGVFGSSLPADGETAWEEARRLGEEIARRGARVICGGYGGVMEAACRGAAQAGGSSVGVVLAGRGDANPWVTEKVVAADLAERLRRLRDLPDAWIVLPRGLGTLLELVWIAESVVKGDTRPRPLVLLGDFWRELAEKAVSEASRPEGAAALSVALRFVATVPEAVDAALGSAQVSKP